MKQNPEIGTYRWQRVHLKGVEAPLYIEECAAEVNTFRGVCVVWQTRRSVAGGLRGLEARYAPDAVSFSVLITRDAFDAEWGKAS